MAGSLTLGRSAHAAGDDTLKVGLIGCGGRGTGAAGNALNADKNAKLVALADAFDDRMQGCAKRLETKYKDRATVDKDHRFVGFDAYKKVIESDVDVVILTTSPHFRPMHLKACIDAGKHVFCEKPVAVDPAGIRSVMATAEEAKKKGLNIVSGLCWRYDKAVQETMKRVLDGAIGDVLSIQETYLTGTLWHRARQPGWSEMDYQMRNWLYFNWLSGDHNNEQHVHSLDKGSWVMGDQPPVAAWGTGGREVRTDPKFGDIYDHHAVVYEYANGTKMHAYCRQMAGCKNDVTDTFVGTEGVCKVLGGYSITGKNAWKHRGRGKGSMYDLEHKALFNAIRAGKPINNGHYMAVSTMLAILGRMCTYSGQKITWDQAMKSDMDLSPASYSFDAAPPTMPDADGKYAIAIPGKTKYV
jgi:myo-inositol 2-dehydrogenase/D-chiro-inositol 1-dehydrogenase